MNTALIIHLAGLLQHAVHGHHFHGWTVSECFEWVQVPGTHPVLRRLVCGTIHVWEHGAVIKWR